MYIVGILVLTLLLLLLLVGPLGWRQPGRAGLGVAVLIPFAILFFSLWAGHLWIAPAGPMFWGVAWLPMLGLGLILALLISFAGQPDHIRRTRTTDPEEPSTEAAIVGGVFWILMIVLLVSIVAGHGHMMA